MIKLDNYTIRETFAEKITKNEWYYAVLNTTKLPHADDIAVSQLDARLIDCVEIVDVMAEKSKTCILSYRWSSDRITNLYNACLRALSWGFDYALCDIVSIKSVDENASPSILTFNQMYRDFPVVHYYPNPLVDSKRIWIASEIHKSFVQSGDNILALMISDKKDDDTMFSYAMKTKILLTFFEQQDHDNRLPDDEMGDASCICFDEYSKYEYRHCDRSNSTCHADKHFGDFFISRLTDNVHELKSGKSIANKKYRGNDRVIHLIEAVLNSEGDDFAGTVPFDIFYILQDLEPQLIQLDDEELRILGSEKHTCLASKITATFLLLSMHGILTKDLTNALSFFPVNSSWMEFIMDIIVNGGQEVDAPEHEEGYFPNWYTRTISETFTGCLLECHVVETSDALLTPTRFILKVLTKKVFVGAALSDLKGSVFCDCEYGRLIKRNQIMFMNQFESAIGGARAARGRPWKISTEENVSIGSQIPESAAKEGFIARLLKKFL